VSYRLRVLVAPFEYRDALTALDVSRAMSRGCLAARPGISAQTLALADGGRGTIDSILAVSSGERRAVSCRDALGRTISANIGLIHSDQRVVIEASAAAGLHLIEPSRRNVGISGTEGVGDLLVAALDLGAEEIVVGLGGTAGLDGGVGLARTLGVKFLDKQGEELPMGGASLSRLERIDMSGLDPRLKKRKIRAVSDVTGPVCGLGGVADVFGPQKGASSSEIVTLDQCLKRLVAVIEKQMGVTLADQQWLTGGGASGVVLSGLFGAEMSSGFDFIADAVKLDERVKNTDLVVTGEGHLDAQSLLGKGVIGLARRASRWGTPVVAICGTVTDDHRDSDCGLTAAFSLTTGPMSVSDAIGNASSLIERSTREAVRLFLAGTHVPNNETQ
jgi:glycerate kinase